MAWPNASDTSRLASPIYTGNHGEVCRGCMRSRKDLTNGLMGVQDENFMRTRMGVCVFVLLCSQAWAWQANINGTANGADEALAVRVDAAGDVVAAGFTSATGSGSDFTVV